jgi:DNA (cytosine-5)-methyltransferase 1
VDEFYYMSEKYYKGLLKHRRRHEKGGSGFGFVVLDRNGISNTLVAGNMGRERNLIKDRKTKKNRWGIRRLSIRECARLQGFPEKFHFPVPFTRAYEQLGNAVTVNVSKAVASALKKYMDGSQPRTKRHLTPVTATIGEFTASQLEKAAAA